MPVAHLPLAQAEATGADEDPSEHTLSPHSVIVLNPAFRGDRVRWCLAMLLVGAGSIAMIFTLGSSAQATSSHGWASFWADPHSYRNQLVEVLRFQGGHACAPQLANRVFLSNISWKDPAGFQSGAHCQRACTWNTSCDGFTWHWQWGCDLKNFSDANTSKFSTAYQKGSYSGYACRREASPYPWIYNEADKHSLPQPKPGLPAPQASMLCLMVVRPYTYEVDLAIMQHKRGISIFQCKHHFIYSSQLIVLAEGLSTRKFNSSQYADIGGQWKTALNTDIFMAFWRAVLADGDYLKTGWTLKVDPDTVWLPQRLRPILLEQERYHNTDGAGAYFQNCLRGMHGPIEVLSQNALRALALHSKQCYWAMNSWGDWQWGEDMWIDLCLKNYAFSRRIYKPQILAEDHCDRWKGRWEGWSLTPYACGDQGTVAFHPLKDEWHYMHCLNTTLPKHGAELSQWEWRPRAQILTAASPDADQSDPPETTDADNFDSLDSSDADSFGPPENADGRPVVPPGAGTPGLSYVPYARSILPTAEKTAQNGSNFSRSIQPVAEKLTRNGSNFSLSIQPVAEKTTQNGLNFSRL